MWFPGDHPLRSLEIMLLGYGLALRVHCLHEPFPFHPNGHFCNWLAARKGWTAPSAGWARAIEARTTAGDHVSYFFTLLDEYRVSVEPEEP